MIPYAEHTKIDLIMIGLRDKGFLERLRLSSISHRVLQYPHCPVVAVR